MSTITSPLLRQFEKNKLFEVKKSKLYGTGILDKIIVKTNHINHEDLINNWIETEYIFEHYYKSGTIFFHKSESNIVGSKICIQLFFNENLKYNYKIQLNPSHFISYDRMIKTIEKLLGQEGLEEHILSRLDCSVLLPEKFIPVKLIAQTMYCPKKRVQESFVGRSSSKSGSNTGYYLGNKPHRVSCYSLSVKIKSKGDDPFKRKLSPFSEATINLEAQIHDLKLRKYDIEKIYDLPKLLKMNPFKDIQFIDFYNISHLEELRNYSSFLLFQIDVLGSGFQTARANWNKNNNFHRMFKKLKKMRVSSNYITIEKLIRISFKRGMKAYFDTS